jgi:Gpi18-like mannosyltransferase
MFYKYLREFKLSKNAWWLTLVFMIFPARWLAVRSIGSPEPWFIFFILASLYFFKKGKYFYAAVLGALAQLTKSPAILLFGAYGIYLLIQSIKLKKIQFQAWPLLLMVAVVPLLFWFYGVRTGDFLAYFHSGDNIHLFWPPFSVFTRQDWVGNFWLEDIIWTWLIFGLGILKLKKKNLTIEYYFAGLYFISTLFVAHRDISRYILPIAPLVLIGWNKTLQKKEFMIIAAILVIPIILFTWNFLLNNTAPIADWAPYL